MKINLTKRFGTFIKQLFKNLTAAFRNADLDSSLLKTG